jgi:hypothetical protein
MNRTALKEWTEILTPWIQVLALLAAGIFALTEYLGKKQEVRVQRAVDHLARFSSSDLTSARMSLTQREQEEVGSLNAILLDKSMSRDQKNVAYYNFVVKELVPHNSQDGLEASFHRILGYLDEGVVCAKQGLCDESTIRSGQSDFGEVFLHTYTPYLCYLRRIWNDPTIGKRVELFYNRQVADRACRGYYDSIQRVSGN